MNKNDVKVLEFLEDMGVFADKVVKKGTKQGDEMICNYRNATGRELGDIFGSYSRAKESAYDHNCKLEEILDGYNMKVFNPCSSSFTQAFTFSFEDKAYILYFTKMHTYIIEV